MFHFKVDSASNHAMKSLGSGGIVAALLENNQTQEGIKIPKVLVPYYGFGLID